MNDLKGIPIAIAGVCDGLALSGNAGPVLHEVRSLLNDLVTSGKSASIDLRSLPLLPGDYEKLKVVLGQGEVSATLEALGVTHVRETAIHGVWWVTHYNSDATIIAEFIEVTTMPEILRTHPADARAGLDLLQSRLTPAIETGRGDGDA
ncbi:MAG TPA: hydrogenase expression/formation C-terminal domain-containing protein [Sulfuricaulis sp.]|nr:hydrogenase expression/formation C-terminal domain-containing protein [Sulfuricaulis sp.]